MKARVSCETRKALVLGDKGWWEKARPFRAPHLIIEEVREAKGHREPANREPQTVNPQTVNRKL